MPREPKKLFTVEVSFENAASITPPIVFKTQAEADKACNLLEWFVWHCPTDHDGESPPWKIYDTAEAIEVVQ